MKKQYLYLALLIFAPSFVYASGAHETGYTSEWQSSETTEESLQRLWRSQASAGELMLKMGSRYQNLYWAAKLGKWEFAKYQTEEMHEAFETIPSMEPELQPSLEAFLSTAYPEIEEAAESRDWLRFEASFEKMRNACMACHKANGHGYIQLPIPKRSNSPVLNMD